MTRLLILLKSIFLPPPYPGFLPDMADSSCCNCGNIEAPFHCRKYAAENQVSADWPSPASSAPPLTPAAFTTFSGTIRLSDCPHPVCFPPLRLYGIPAVFSAGECWLSHVDALFLYSMIGSPTPQQHPKSRHIDKLMSYLPLT